MREILFRGKWLGNGEWVEGYYCKISETTYAFAEDYERNPIPVHHYILQEVMTDWGLPNRFNQYEVDPETLCQYTELKDKNGNRIWENDIIKHEISDTIGTVKWYQEDYVGWCVDDTIIDEQQFTDEMWNECEVIGNIFDTPEMLKKQ